MTLDARAYAWCNLGPLAPGGGSSIAESHVQGAGVITYRGTINLAGIHRPAPGAVVELAYCDGQNWIARLPLRLRVLSSFANPLGGKTTAVSVGCDLAYFEDRKQPPTSLSTRQANPDTPEAVWRAAAPAIPAAWLVGQILAALGLTAAGACPLTNHYTRQEFDLTAGYVEELGKLSHSEGYAVRMNPAGQVEFINKAPEGLATSVLLTEADLIDLNPINTGDLPGDSVYAKYTSLKLKAPDNPDENERQKRNWELEQSFSPKQVYLHQWTEYIRAPVLDQDGSPTYRQRKDANGKPVFYIQGQSISNGLQTTLFGEAVMDQVFEVRAYQLQERITYITQTTTRTTYNDKDQVTSRKTESQGQWAYEYTETFYTYNNDGELVKEVTTEVASLATVKMSVGFQSNYRSIRGGGTGESYLSRYREVEYERSKATGITKTVTTSFVPFINTTDGSEAISRLRDAGNQLDESRLDQILAIATKLVSAGSEVRIRTEREFGVQRRPSEAERTASANQKAPTVEQESQTTWAMGSATSQTQVELSPPYAPDDRIVASGSTYSVIKSDADQKALHFARTENRLLLGHRNGVGIQVLPEMLPPVPLGLINIRLNGCTAAFRVNGTTWNIDPQGVTATTDALFWGAIDGTVADAWFPLPPGASSLPAPVAASTNANIRPANAINIPSGFNFTNPNLSALFASLPTDAAPVFGRTVTPAVLVKPYHETIDWTAGGGGGVFVSTLPWAPQTVSLTAGGGGGVAVGQSLRITAGGGAGVFATPEPSIALKAGGGGGAFAAGGELPLLSYASGTSMNWDDPQVLYGFSFTLATAKTVAALGVYDPGGNGLGSSYSFAITTSSDLSIFPDNAILIDGQSETTIPSGATAPLVDGYRKVSITSRPTLSPGTYWLVLLPNGVDVDPILKNLSGVATASGVTFGVNAQWESGGAPEHTTDSGDGVAYVGPMIWFA